MQYAANVPQQDFSGSNTSTQDASESVMSNQAMFENIPDHVQNQMKLLTQDEIQILYRLDYYCFDQSGCRLLQQMIQDEDSNGKPQSPQKKAFL